MVSNPKGGNQVPSIRIRCRLIFHVFSTSYEKRFSIKITLLSSRFKNLLWSRTRREEIKCPLSESAVDSFFMSSRHLMKNVFLSKLHFCQADSRIYYGLEPEGRKSSALYQNPLSTHFFMSSRHLMKNVFPSK